MSEHWRHHVDPEELKEGERRTRWWALGVGLAVASGAALFVVHVADAKDSTPDTGRLELSVSGTVSGPVRIVEEDDDPAVQPMVVNAPVPWKRTITVTGEHEIFLTADGTGAGSLTCTVRFQGRTVTTRTVAGSSPSVKCDVVTTLHEVHASG